MSISIKERQELRKKLLFDLYDYYFNNSGAPFRTTRDELIADREVELAYQYLESKRLITIERQGNQLFLIKPTAIGIDYVESQILNEEHNAAE
jgi:hypothetical protein